jgi:hypothetical protein
VTEEDQNRSSDRRNDLANLEAALNGIAQAKSQKKLETDDVNRAVRSKLDELRKELDRIIAGSSVAGRQSLTQNQQSVSGQDNTQLYEATPPIAQQLSSASQVITDPNPSSNQPISQPTTSQIKDQDLLETSAPEATLSIKSEQALPSDSNDLNTSLITDESDLYESLLSQEFGLDEPPASVAPPVSAPVSQPTTFSPPSTPPPANVAPPVSAPVSQPTTFSPPSTPPPANVAPPVSAPVSQPTANQYLSDYNYLSENIKTQQPKQSQTPEFRSEVISFKAKGKKKRRF